MRAGVRRDRRCAGDRLIPAASQDHSKANPTRNQPVMLQLHDPRPAGQSACAESPLAGFDRPDRRSGSLPKLKAREPLEAEPVVRVGRGRPASGRASGCPQPVYGALVAGSERGQTVADNQAAFAELGMAPHVAGQQAERSMATHA